MTSAQVVEQSTSSQTVLLRTTLPQTIVLYFIIKIKLLISRLLSFQHRTHGDLARVHVIIIFEQLLLATLCTSQIEASTSPPSRGAYGVLSSPKINFAKQSVNNYNIQFQLITFIFNVLNIQIYHKTFDCRAYNIELHSLNC